MLRQIWWKLLGVLIFGYVLVAGLLTPLKPGITDATPYTAVAGSSVDVKVEGYNTHFEDGQEQIAFLKNREQQVIQSSSFHSEGNQSANFRFDLPDMVDVEKERLTLVVNNSLDGSIILPDAITVTQGSNTLGNSATWKPFDVSSLHILEDFRFPYRNTLNETIRNTFFHVAIWFAMFILFIVGLIYSIKYLLNRNLKHDHIAAAFTEVGIVFGIVGLATGSIWAKYTWGTWWTDDVKLNMSAVAMLIYFAYSILRLSVKDVDSKARLSSAYNIFSFAILIPLIFVLPRMTDSLHPGNGGNPALGGEDLDNSLRMVFYPAVIGLTLIGVWMSTLVYRIGIIKDQWINDL
jgi:heme exporter protein C